MPEAVVALGERKRIVGRLRFDSDGRRQHSRFEYDEAWLAAEDRFALAPGLPLRGGRHFSSAKDDKRSALPGCFGDAATDRFHHPGIEQGRSSEEPWVHLCWR